MKIAIIYSTLIKDTKESAKILENLINANTVLISIDNAKDVCLLKYNFIILGASTYNNKVQGSFKRYLSRNMKTLLEKPTALYVNSDENLDIIVNLNKVFTKELIESSFVYSNFGYNVNADIGNFMKKRKLKKNENIIHLNENEIKNYAIKINEIIGRRVD